MFKCNSQYLSIKNGVRQGVVVSPTLFYVYVDTLLISLKETGVGCYISCFFTGSMGYADDIILLAATRHVLQVMLNICKIFLTHTASYLVQQK